MAPLNSVQTVLSDQGFRPQLDETGLSFRYYGQPCSLSVQDIGVQPVLQLRVRLPRAPLGSREALAWTAAHPLAALSEDAGQQLLGLITLFDEAHAPQATQSVISLLDRYAAELVLGAASIQTQQEQAQQIQSQPGSQDTGLTRRSVPATASAAGHAPRLSRPLSAARSQAAPARLTGLATTEPLAEPASQPVAETAAAAETYLLPVAAQSGQGTPHDESAPPEGWVPLWPQLSSLLRAYAVGIAARGLPAPIGADVPMGTGGVGGQALLLWESGGHQLVLADEGERVPYSYISVIVSPDEAAEQVARRVHNAMSMYKFV